MNEVSTMTSYYVEVQLSCINAKPYRSVYKQRKKDVQNHWKNKSKIKLSKLICIWRHNHIHCEYISLKGHMNWISEKQRLPEEEKNSAKARSYGEELHGVRFYDQRERKYVIYVHIDVNLHGWGWLCCCSTFSSWKIKWWRSSCLKSRPLQAALWCSCYFRWCSDINLLCWCWLCNSFTSRTTGD